MNRTFIRIGIVTSAMAASWLGCSGTGNHATTTTTTGAGGATSGTGSTTSTTQSSSTTGTGGGGTGGSRGGDAGTGIECNPVTNAPCATGQECDANYDSNMTLVGFACFPSNNVGLCQACDPTMNKACGATSTCVLYDQAGDMACARYCCTDADCGTGGTCVSGDKGTPFFSDAPTLGFCVQSSTLDGGAGDAGSAASDLFQCTVPSTPPSGGSCVTVSQ